MDTPRGGVVLYLVAAVLACSAAQPAWAEDFLLRDGDRVAFLGDSITAARGYTKIIEHYTLMRFPDRKVRFYNAGKGGDTAQSSIGRLQRDVFDQQATVVTIALGVNDIGWGARADQQHKQQYLDGVRTLITQCQERGVRVILCSPAITAEPADKAEPGFLQQMADEGFEVARSLGAATVDVQRGMREIQRRVERHNDRVTDKSKAVSLHAADGIHLNDLGQLAMAYAILKGLGAPAEVSSATIDARSGAATAASGCQVSDVHVDDAGVSFTRLDEGLPLNRGALSSLDYLWVPVPEGLNRYLLAVTNLPPGEYELSADGRPLGVASAERLAAGINIASMTPDPWVPGGPWNVQSDVVKELVDARDNLFYGELLQQRYWQADPQFASLTAGYRELDDRLVELQRQTARPRAYRFEVRRKE